MLWSFYDQKMTQAKKLLKPTVTFFMLFNFWNPIQKRSLNIRSHASHMACMSHKVSAFALIFRGIEIEKSKNSYDSGNFPTVNSLFIACEFLNLVNSGLIFIFFSQFSWIWNTNTFIYHWKGYRWILCNCGCFHFDLASSHCCQQFC